MLPSKKEFERRIHERVEYRGYCAVISCDTSWTGNVINLSESGALIAILDEHQLQTDENVTINIDLATGGSAILHGRVAHIKDHFIGLECTPHGEEDRLRLREFLQSAGLELDE